MALHCYFKPVSKLPDPNGPLSKEIPSVAIMEANKSVEQATRSDSKKQKNIAGLHLHR